MIIGFCIELSNCFYLPGLAPVNYCKEGETSQTCKVSEFSLYIIPSIGMPINLC